MRRIIIFGIFGLGLYYLWYNNDRTAQLIAIGVMGVALLLEFASKD
jgi:multisubunit Na+/H+ antiporter MnhC subunit